MQKGENTHVVISTGTIIKFFLVVGFIYFAFLLKDIILVILTSVVVASAVEPGTKWFVRRGLPRVIAVLLIYILIFSIFAFSFYFLLLPLLNDSSVFLRDLPEYSKSLSTGAEVRSPSAANSIFEGFSSSFSLPSLIDNVNNFVEDISTGFFGAVDVVFGGIISFLLIIALSFYLAVQEDGVVKFLRVVAPLRVENYAIDLWKRSQIKIGLWFQGQVVLALVVGILVFLGLSLLKIDHALLLGFLAAVFELIPIFGQFLSAVPGIAIAYLGGGVTIALVVAGYYLIVQQFESQLIYPLVVKKVVGVPPMISILAFVIGAKLAGFLGIILSVPVAAVLMELLSDFEKRKTSIGN